MPSRKEQAECMVTDHGGARLAFAVDPEVKASNLKRLRRIEGQIRGIAKMVEQEKYCADVIVQVASAQEALRSVARALMRNHLHHCTKHTLETGAIKQRTEMYDELLDLIYRHLR